MIRYLLIGTLVLFLLLLFALPAKYGADRLIAQLRIEHELNRAYWGEDFAWQSLALAMSIHAAGLAAAQPAAAALPGSAPANPAVALDAAGKQIEATVARLFDNPYTASVGALMTLFAYRMGCFLLALPLALLFVFACMLDGFTLRWVKSRDFRAHNPEIYAAFGTLAVLVVGATLVASLFPITIYPYLLLLPPTLTGIGAGFAIANYHARV